MSAPGAAAVVPALRRPPALSAGARVRVVAPASPFEPARFERGVAQLRQLGLTPVYDAGLFARDDYLAGGDDARARALVEALADPDSPVIWCARGGYGAMRLLPRLAGATVTTPKLLVGFSDISALLALWWQRFNTCAVHGPVITSLADEPEASLAHLWRVLEGRASQTRIALEPTPELPVWQGAPVVGTLYASNLTLLAHLCGTPFQPRLDDCILAVEDVGEAPYRLDRLCTHLRLAGALQGVRAVVLGRFCGPDAAERAEVLRALQRGLADLGVPIFATLPMGHQAPNMAIPVGARGRIDASHLTLLEDAVAATRT